MKAVILSLVIGFIFSACSLSLAALDAIAVPHVADILATQTVQAPAASPTFTASPTATATLMPSPTPTRTIAPDPTATPTITPTPTPRLMGAALSLDDLPSGFSAAPAGELDEIRRGLSVDAIAFAFGNEETSQVVMGYLIPYTSRTEQLSFDQMIPELVDAFAASFGANTDPEMLRGLDDVGESRVAFTFLSESLNFSYRWDIILFRRGEIGVFLFVGYLDGEAAAITIGDLARLQDQRVQVQQPGAAADSHPAVGPQG